MTFKPRGRHSLCLLCLQHPDEQVVWATRAWVTEGRLRYHGDDDPTQHVIVSRTFIENARTLARYLEASKQVRE